jgi:putative transposase
VSGRDEALPRPLREQVEGGIYHLASRGVRKLPIFTDDRDRERFLWLLHVTAERYGWQIHAYVLMTNHFHLLVTTPGGNVSAGMQYLNSRYCQWFNWRHGYEGHVLEKRFYSDLIKTDEKLVNVARYIVLNPVRAGLCTTAAAWRWSSYQAMVATLTTLPRISRWLLDLFHRELDQARERFAEFVRAGEPHAVG